MFPAVRFEELGALLGDEGKDRPARAGFQDAADARYGDAGNGARHAGGGRTGEEQLVVFTSMESLGEGCCRVDGQGSRIDLSRYAGLLAEMSKVGREAIAQVEGSRGQPATLQPETLGNARLGIEVWGE